MGCRGSNDELAAAGVVAGRNFHPRFLLQSVCFSEWELIKGVVDLFGADAVAIVY
jgi:hypothetical protein